MKTKEHEAVARAVTKERAEATAYIERENAYEIKRKVVHDLELRKEAMTFAVEISRTKHYTTEMLTDLATKIYEFLRGEN